MEEARWSEVRRRFAWLAGLPPGEEAELRRAATGLDFDPGETIFVPNRQPTHVFLLARGLARVYRLSESGAEVSLGYVAPGEVFGELTGLGGYPRESFAQAVRPSRVWRLAGKVFRRVLEAEPKVLLEVTRQIGNRFKRMEARVEQLVFRDVLCRVALMLLELAHDFGRPAGDGSLVDLPLTQAELAALVGASRQTVNASLQELTRQGLLARRGRRFVIRKPDELQRLAAPHA